MQSCTLPWPAHLTTAWRLECHHLPDLQVWVYFKHPKGSTRLSARTLRTYLSLGFTMLFCFLVCTAGSFPADVHAEHCLSCSAFWECAYHCQLCSPHGLSLFFPEGSSKVGSFPNPGGQHQTSAAEPVSVTPPTPRVSWYYSALCACLRHSTGKRLLPTRGCCPFIYVLLIFVPPHHRSQWGLLTGNKLLAFLSLLQTMCLSWRDKTGDEAMNPCEPLTEERRKLSCFVAKQCVSAPAGTAPAAWER